MPDTVIPWMVMLPGGVLPGAWVSRVSPSMKTKLFGGGAQTNGLVLPGVLLTRSILRLKSVPDPLSGVKSSEKAERRNVLIGPGPGRMLAETFQFPPPVSPAACINGAEKAITLWSKVKSPWKPT